MELETRACNQAVTAEERADGEKTIKSIVGYAAVFETLSENLGGFREKIAKGAFDPVLSDDVRAVFNHDPSFILGRTAAGTLKISVDDTGLRYEVEPPDTQGANDLLTSIARGDVTQSSFSFQVDEDDWQEDDEGRVVRTIKSFAKLRDVSPVTFPAYPDATVGVRSLEEWKIKSQDFVKRSKEMLYLELNLLDKR